VTCYRQPDYVRSVTLYDGMKNTDVFDEVIYIHNTSTGVWRYFQVFYQLLKVRVRQNPDTYLLTFRGYEILPFLLLIAAGKQVIYDEFINPVEWFKYEHNKLGLGTFWGVVLRPTYRFLGKRVDFILADTPSHAEYSAKLMNLPLAKYRSIPVSTDEKIFRPAKSTVKSASFTVLFVGNMLPLYGIEYVLDAAVQLAGHTGIEFTIVGGKKRVADQVAGAQKRGARITYTSWVPYEHFPALFHSSDLCLSGPFGKTVQSQFIITGKTYQFLAAGLPVVIGDNKEAHEFNDRHNALIVPAQDADALRDAIEWAATHRKDLVTIGLNGRKLYDQKFSSRRVADDLRQLFTTK
jgi:glycosyltransferase involved in cell wall biosynthesis